MTTYLEVSENGDIYAPCSKCNYDTACRKNAVTILRRVYDNPTSFFSEFKDNKNVYDHYEYTSPTEYTHTEYNVGLLFNTITSCSRCLRESKICRTSWLEVL